MFSYYDFFMNSKQSLKLAVASAVIFSFVVSGKSHAQELPGSDEALLKTLKGFGVRATLKPRENKPEALVAKIALGKKLFHDKNLSGNRRINCQTCHDPRHGTSDGKALSQTEDGKGILRRNSPALFNLEAAASPLMFWDGRVEYNTIGKYFITTPEKSLNGPSPKSSEITSVLSGALAAQALFPLLSHEEMRGRAGENEIADAKNNLEAWDLLLNRLKTESDSLEYLDLFRDAYPGTIVEKINIGHVGEAMSAFMKNEFQSSGSPFQRFVAGETNAMTAQQKRGLDIFSNKGRCIVCHQGPVLGGNGSALSIGVPSFGAAPFKPDRGMGEISPGLTNFSFKTPALINVSLSAPYMHNGVFKTLKEVINHYNSVRTTLTTFVLTPERKKEFPVAVEQLNSEALLNEIWASIQFPFIRSGLGLTRREMDDLEAFIDEGLTDPKWKAVVR